MSVQLKPQPDLISAEQVEHLIQSKIGSSIRDLLVELVDGTIFVYGRTNAYYQKQMVSHLIMSTQKDLDLINKIEVD